MNPYSVPTEQEKQQMLKAIGVSSVSDLFSDIPEAIRLTEDPGVMPEGVSEHEALEELKALARENKLGTSFLGCGSYDRIIPAAVHHLANLPAFLTSYTPYQPEVSQGTLQAMFEYQSMICELTGLDVTNASLYDGHTAAAEAVMIARSVKRRGGRLLISETVHPHTVEVIKTHLLGADIDIEMVPQKDGVTDLAALEKQVDADTVAVLGQSPNIFGYAEDFSDIAQGVQQHKGLLIVSANPSSLGLLKSPGEQAADIAVGDLQPFGIPACFGGPSAGYITARQSLLRKLPGRIVGETQDHTGRRAYVLTLQAREQHIKRERATSNICSNQAQAALTASIYIALVGFQGIREAAWHSACKAAYLRSGLEGQGLSLYGSGSSVGEFTIQLPEAEEFLQRMYREYGIFAGVHLGALKESLEGLVTVSVTEKRTKAELDAYLNAAREVLA
ncbi:MAG: aminomethyl-transferring glycine dehydrogenase subunit GcvPA [Spirochaetota bacterium]